MKSLMYLVLWGNVLFFVVNACIWIATGAGLFFMLAMFDVLIAYMCKEVVNI